MYNVFKNTWKIFNFFGVRVFMKSQVTNTQKHTTYELNKFTMVEIEEIIEHNNVINT